MAEQVADACPAPGRFDKLGREQARHADAQRRVSEPHQDQSEQEIGNGDTDVINNRKEIIDERVWMRRAQNAGRYRDDPGEDKRKQSQHNRQHKPFADQFIIGPLIFQRQAEIAAHDVFHPALVLNFNRLIETELLLEGRDLGFINRRSRRSQRRNITVQKVTGRCLDQDKNDDRKQEEQQGQ